MTRQRISFVIQAAPDEPYLISVLKQLKPSTIGVIDDAGLLKRILDAVPEIKVGWLRFYGANANDEGKLWTRGDESIKDLIGRFQKTGLAINPRAYLYVGNEPVEHGANLTKMLAWQVEFMRRAKAVGVHCVMGNFGSAVYEQSEIDSGAFDGFLTELSDGYHVFGIHEYGPPILPAGAAGKIAEDMLLKQLVQQEKWPSPWDTQVSKSQGGSMEANFYIGRLYRWDARSMYLSIANPGVKPARKIITEAGQDRFDRILHIYQEIEQRYRRDEFHDGKLQHLIVPWPHFCLRGVNTTRWLLEDYYPAWGFNRAVLEQLKWLAWVYDDTIYRVKQQNPTIEGVNLFVWTSPDKRDWAQLYGFDYSQNRELHDLLIAWTRELETPVPPPPEPPPPTPVYPDLPALDDPRWQRAFLQSKRGNGVYVRAHPNMTDTELHIAYQDDRVSWIAAAAYTDNAGDVYYPMKISALSLRGWVAAKAADFIDIPDLPAPEPPTPPLPPDVPLHTREEAQAWVNNKFNEMVQMDIILEALAEILRLKTNERALTKLNIERVSKAYAVTIPVNGNGLKETIQ